MQPQYPGQPQYHQRPQQPMPSQQPMNDFTNLESPSRREPIRDSFGDWFRRGIAIGLGFIVLAIILAIIFFFVNVVIMGAIIVNR